MALGPRAADLVAQARGELIDRAVEEDIDVRDRGVGVDQRVLPGLSLLFERAPGDELLVQRAGELAMIIVRREAGGGEACLAARLLPPRSVRR
ncbi:MAG: hypothetical protein EXR72_05265 [Myxococcales bacterium]|nr:hypothetical protein [Myxococcales bacterium]